jgi:DNA-directed RNA polymerase subunit RPC12/RpoP
VNRVFWATCPACVKAFIVNWELRHAGRELICPYCSKRFLPEQAASLDERYAAS